MKDTGQEELLAARYRLAGFNIEVAEHAFTAGGIRLPRRIVDPARSEWSDRRGSCHCQRFRSRLHQRRRRA